MIIYGIQTPETKRHPSTVYWFSLDSGTSWRLFFGDKPVKFSLFEGITAYKAIGYKCIQLNAEITDWKEEEYDDDE